MSKPINVAIPNTSTEKMEAIAAVSRAIENLSKALISVQVEVTVSNNTITVPKGGSGITVSTEDES